MTKILGLDLGTNSIGWALVDDEKNTSTKLLDKGVVIFSEGVKKRFKTTNPQYKLRALNRYLTDNSHGYLE